MFVRLFAWPDPTSTCAVHTLRRYLAHGTATDYMFEVLRVPMPYTWEIYGDFSADFHDCFRMFNPVGAPALREVTDRWLRAMLRLFELVPSHPAMAAVEKLQAAASGLNGTEHVRCVT